MGIIIGIRNIIGVTSIEEEDPAGNRILCEDGSYLVTESNEQLILE